MSSTGPVGVAIVGAGWAGERHAAAYRARPEAARIVAVVDADAAIAAARGHQWAASLATTDLDAALARPEIAAVSICVPHRLHVPLALAALAASKHVIVEQPFATSTEEAESLIRTAARVRRFVMVAETSRFDPVYLHMADMVLSDEIGAPYLVRIARDQHRHAILRARPWSLTDPASGAMWGGGIHDVETFRMVTGGLAIQEVYAVAARSMLPELAGDDTSVATLRAEYGCVGLLSESYAAFAPEGLRVRVEVFGVHGAISTNGDGAITITTPDGNRVVRVPQGDVYDAMLAHFLDCVQRGDEPATSAYAMRPGLHAILAAQTSTVVGAPVAPESESTF